VFSVDSSSKVAVVALIIMGLSASIAIIYPIYALQVAQKTYVPTYAISAQALTEEPAAFIHIDNPDQYVLRVTANPNESVEVSEDDTQIITVIQERGTSNIEVNGSYYKISIASIDAFPPEILNAPTVVILGSFGFVTALIVFITALEFKGKRRFKQKANEGLKSAR